MSDRRRRHAAVWQAMLNRLEPRLRASAARCRTAFLREAAGAYQNNGVVPGWVTEAHRRNVTQALTDHYGLVIPRFRSLFLRGFKSHAMRMEVKAAGDLFLALMQEWISREALRKAQMIAATDMEDVRNAIREGVDEGEGTDAIARRIRGVSSMTATRAATVARTETNAAAAFGYIESARDASQTLGVQLRKVWLPTLDQHTRDAHAEMENHPAIPLNEKFTVGGELMDRPGDPSASAANTINCRCSLAVEEATD
jgi:hypothetical protein